MLATIDIRKVVGGTSVNLSVSYDGGDEKSRAAAIEEIRLALAELAPMLDDSNGHVVTYNGGKLGYTIFKGKQVLRWYGDKWTQYGVPVYDEVLNDDFRRALDGKLQLQLTDARIVKVAMRDGKPVKVVHLE